MNKKNIFRIVILNVTLALFILASSAHAQLQGDMLFKAMQDELDRNMAQLVMPDLEKPYFISYTIDDFEQMELTASLGTIAGSKVDRGRYLTTDLRVGNYSLDNSNFISGFSGFGGDFTPIPVDNSYDAVRNQIYLATDNAYKDALEIYSKKRAYLQTRMIPNRPDDFFKLPPNRHLDKPQEFDIDKTKFEDLAKAATAVFRDYPAIMSSELKVTASVVNQYLVNSAGSHALRGDRIYGFELTMGGKSPDGMSVADGDRIVVTSSAEIPTQANLVVWAKANAERMNHLIKADTLDEYVGPVIFTDDASGEFFRQLFAKNVSNLPGPMYENDQMSQMMGGGSELGDKLNRRVLPTFFNVYDDPTIAKVGNDEVIGAYDVDDAGNVPQKVSLVESGKLVNLLIGIAPTKKIKEPNGHARGAVGKEIGAKPSNMVFESTDKVPYDKLKQTLISLCKDIDLPYGLIIKRLRDYNAPMGGFSFFGQRPGPQEELTPPLEVYKLYPDGREVPARGLQFNNVTVRILKDIQQTDDQMHVYNYLVGNDYEMPASIVSPSVLVEEMELKKSEEKVKKLPILPSPLAGN